MSNARVNSTFGHNDDGVIDAIRIDSDGDGVYDDNGDIEDLPADADIGFDALLG